MKDQLLSYYHQELDYLREAGYHFSQKHPKVAGLLKLDQQGTSDPFVERLLQSFAFLTAKAQANHDQDQNSLAKSLLDILYPMATLPLPSVSTIQFKPSSQCDHVIYINKHTQLETNPDIDKKCYFRTGYDLDLMPLDIEQASIEPITELPENVVGPSQAKSFLRFKLNAQHESFDFNQMIDKPLNIYVNAYKSYAQSLIAYLLQHQMSVSVRSQADKDSLIRILKKPLASVGYTHDDLLIPCEKSGYEDCQVFTEFSAFPQKHQYIALNPLYHASQKLETANLEFFIFLDHFDASMSEAMAKAEFCLGCVPIINIFASESKSMVFEQEVLERPLEPALALNKEEVEIYKVQSCQVWAKGGKDYITQPMYQSSFAAPSNMPTVYWQASQQPCWQLGAPDLPGTETLIQIKMPAEMKQQHYLYASLLCTNRDAVLSANFCQQADELVMTDAKDQQFSTHLLYQPSAPVRVEQTNNLYQVLGILAAAQQQMFSLENDPNQVEYIKKALHALNRSGHEEVTQLIDQLVAVKCSRITKRHSVNHQLVYVSGLEVKITMPIEPSQQGLFYLFGQALNVWSQHYCPMNSFVSITIINQQTGKSMSWPTKFH